MLKRQKGITLIALVITIIVLLILAGVSINLVVGEGGILTKAQNAVTKTEEAKQKELEDLDSMAGVIDNYLNNTPSEEPGNAGGENVPEVPETPITASATVTASPSVFNHDEIGESTITTTVTKSDPGAELKYTYKFLKKSGAIDAVPVYTGEEEIISTSDSEVAFTYRPASGGVYVYVELEIADLNGNILNTKTCEIITITCLPAGTMITVEDEEDDENGKKKKRRKKKRVEDLTYDDDLVVWDFDKGCFATTKPLWLKKSEVAEEYNLLKFSDGSELKTIRQHRIFNKELGKFTYPMTEETPIGTTTFNENGKEVKLVSKEVIKEKVEYYNVISNYHMNVFAEGILTSCRLSNLYEIKDMKYVKDDRKLASREEYKEIPDEYFYGLRIAEQPKEINRGNDDKNSRTLVEYVKNLINLKK